MEQFSQSTSWTLAEDLRHLKGHERSPHNQVGQKKDRKRKSRGRGTGPALPGGELKQKRGSCTWWSPLIVGEIRWERRGVSAVIQRRAEQQSEAGRTEWDLQGRQGFGTGTWHLETKPGERTLVSCREMVWGDRSEEIHNLECLWRKHRREVSLLSDARGVEPFVASLPGHRPFLPRH